MDQALLLYAITMDTLFMAGLSSAVEYVEELGHSLLQLHYTVSGLERRVPLTVKNTVIFMYATCTHSIDSADK